MKAELRPAVAAAAPQSLTSNPRSRAPDRQPLTPSPHSPAAAPQSLTPTPRCRAPGPQPPTPNPHSRAPGPHSRAPGPHSLAPGPRPLAPPEAFVAWLWAQRQLGVHLQTTDGRPVQVIYPGRRAGSWGPDFHGALLAIDGAMARGDVEVHVRPRDWHLHAHGSDPAYAATVLHVVFEAEPCLPCLRPDGLALPTVALAPLLGSSLAAMLAQWRAAKGPPADPGPCLSPEEAGPLLDRAGLDRFRARAGRFEGDLTWVEPLQALWTGLLETLGYSANTAPFRRLSERLPAAEAKELARSGDPLLLPAVLFGESSLLPSQRGRLPLDDYMERVEGVWRSTGRTGPARPLGWRWVGSRPGNGPVRRVAAVASLVADASWPPAEGALLALQELPPGRAARALRSLLLRPGGPYWRGHGDFGRSLRRPSALIGPERAADAVVNALLPWAAAVGRQRGDAVLERDAEAVYLAHPPLADNQITRHMARQLLGAQPRSWAWTACRQQGLIALYRGWCDARDCMACPAGGTMGEPRQEALLRSRMIPVGGAARAPAPTTASAGRPSTSPATTDAVFSIRSCA